MFISIMAVAALAQAQPAAAPASASPTAAPKLVCKSEVIVGSLMPKRTCHTREQWAAEAKANQQMMERERRYSRVPSM